MKLKAELMDETLLKRAVTRMSFEIIEKFDNLSNVVLLGVRRRGVPLAHMIAENIQKHQQPVTVGTIDITFYRDDLAHKTKTPQVHGIEVDVDLDDKDVVIVDDVLFTGRTARAAMEAVFALGRPKTIRLAILIDRGHRELPIRADFVGKNVPTSTKEFIAVNFPNLDGKCNVELRERD